MKLKVAPRHQTVNIWPGAIAWVYYRFEDDAGQCIAFGSCRLRQLHELTALMLCRPQQEKS